MSYHKRYPRNNSRINRKRSRSRAKLSTRKRKGGAYLSQSTDPYSNTNEFMFSEDDLHYLHNNAGLKFEDDKTLIEQLSLKSNVNDAQRFVTIMNEPIRFRLQYNDELKQLVKKYTSFTGKMKQRFSQYTPSNIKRKMSETFDPKMIKTGWLSVTNQIDDPETVRSMAYYIAKQKGKDIPTTEDVDEAVEASRRITSENKRQKRKDSFDKFKRAITPRSETINKIKRFFTPKRKVQEVPVTQEYGVGYQTEQNDWGVNSSNNEPIQWRYGGKRVSKNRNSKRLSNYRTSKSKRSKRQKKSNSSRKSKSYFKKGNKLSEEHRKYCRCIYHVSAQQSKECLKNKRWGENINGKQCYNPYAVCSASVHRKGQVDCFNNTRLSRLPRNEIEHLAALKGLSTTQLKMKKQVKQVKHLK